MTVADSNNTRRSWLGVLRPGKSPDPEGIFRAESDPKVPADIADLLVMSTTDQKTPAASPGSADLLDAMVQEHLERATDLSGETPAAEAAILEQEMPAAPSEEGGSLEDSAAMLQREIDVLLHDAGADEGIPAPAEAVTAERVEVVVPAAEVPAVDEIEQNAPVAEEPVAAVVAAADVANKLEDARGTAEHRQDADATAAPATKPDISREELDVLLAGDAAAQAVAAPATEAAIPMPAAENAVSELVEEEKLNEAEGVLAEELAKLMADSDEARAETDGVAAKSHAIVDESHPIPEAPAADATPLAAPVPAETAVEPPAPEPVVLATTEPEPPAPALGKRRLIEGLALIVAQLIDLPFGWINDLDRNIIGVAAFLLLLGGVVLFVMSRIPGM